MEDIFKPLGDKLECDFSLGLFSAYKLGGKAKFLTKVKTPKELFEVVQLCKKQNIRYQVIGSASQLLVSDQGYNGMIILNAINKIEKSGDLWTIYSGTKIHEVAKQTVQEGRGGFEGLAGLPGTIGAGIVCNTGDYGFQVADWLKEVDILTPDGEIKRVKRSFFDYCPLSSSVKGNESYIVISGTFNCLPYDKQELMHISLSVQRRRALLQRYPCAYGPFFQSVSDVDLEMLFKQLRIDTLEVNGAYSILEPYHRIVYKPGTTSMDIWNLSHEIKRIVLEKTGIQLQENISYIGDFSPFDN